MSIEADFPTGFCVDRGYPFNFSAKMYSSTSPTKVPYVFEPGDTARFVIDVPGADQIATGVLADGEIKFEFTAVQTALMTKEYHDYFFEVTLSGVPQKRTRGKVPVR